MNLGQPSVFSEHDSARDMASKLNNTFGSVWRLLQLVQGSSVVAEAAADVFGHTSEMPDTNSLNADHDRRYFRQALIKAAIDMKPYLATDTVGNQSITGTPATLTLDTEAIANANYSLSANEVTIAKKGTYLAFGAVIYDITDDLGGTRGSVEVWLESDDGGSYAAVAGSYGRNYHREASGGSGPWFGVPFVHANDSKKVRIRMDRINGTTNIDTAADRSKLFLVRLPGF